MARIAEPAKDIRFVHGNFFDEALVETSLEGMPPVELILADPPYNIADKGKVTKAHGKLWSNAEAWGDHFNDKMSPEEYRRFIVEFLARAWNLLPPGGSLVTFIDRGYAGRLIEIAENIVRYSSGRDIGEGQEAATIEYFEHKCVPSGFVYKNQLVFFKTNSVPKIRTTNYGSAYEVAVWLVKPQNWKQAKPAVFNYCAPIKNLRLYPEEAWQGGRLVKKHGRLDVAEYHNTCSSNVFLYSIGSKTVGHPCEKYTAMLRPVVEHHSNPGGLVLDPFAGGFNSALVAQALGRRFVGFEIAEEWVEKGLEAFQEQEKEKVS